MHAPNAGPDRRAAVAWIAAGGVLLGHWLTYALIGGSEPHREALLASSGHGYLSFANDLGLAALLIGLGTVVAGRMGHTGGPPPRTALRLVAFQTGGFLSMEVLERLGSGAPMGGLAHGGIIPAGLLIQAAVALGGAALIRWMFQVVAVAAGRGRAPRLHLVSGAGYLLLPGAPSISPAWASPGGNRGPPPRP